MLLLYKYLVTYEFSIASPTKPLPFIELTIKIIVNNKYIIITDFSNPYTIPPTSLNCFIIGIFAIESDKKLKNIIIILIAIYKTIAVKISTAFTETVSATVSIALFFASFVFSEIIPYTYFFINVLFSYFSSSLSFSFSFSISFSFSLSFLTSFSFLLFSLSLFSCSPLV